MPSTYDYDVIVIGAGHAGVEAACAAANHPLTLRMREGYDHSYYFVATYIGDHVAWHARALKAG
jgi:S-formylglutathione hydrolase FrmB